MKTRKERRARLVERSVVMTALALGLAMLGVSTSLVGGGNLPADEPSKGNSGPVTGPGGGQPEPAPAKLGLIVNDPRAFPGYTLIAPLNSRKTYLIDELGRVVKTWESKYEAGQEAYLLENGHLLRAAKLDDREQMFGGAGRGGRIQEFTWDGELIWDFKFHDDTRIGHHDICRLPNGNVLLLVWEIKTAEEAVAAGRKPESVRGPGLSDSVAEVKPTGKTTGEVVWEWHALGPPDPGCRPHEGKLRRRGQVPRTGSTSTSATARSASPAAAQPARRAGISPRRAPRRKTRQRRRGKWTGSRRIGYVGSPTAAAKPGSSPTGPTPTRSPTTPSSIRS